MDSVNVGVGLDAADYFGNTLALAFGVLSTTATTGFKTLEVGPQVQANLTAGASFSDFRVRMVTEFNGNGSDDYTQFNNSTDAVGSGQKTTLTITYQP